MNQVPIINLIKKKSLNHHPHRYFPFIMMLQRKILPNTIILKHFYDLNGRKRPRE